MDSDICSCRHHKEDHRFQVQSGRIWVGDCKRCGCSRFSLAEAPAERWRGGTG